MHARICLTQTVKTIMTEKEFTEISLTLGLTFGISYMLFIVYKLAEESNAGRYGMMILFVGLGLGISIVPEMCARADQSKQRRYRVIGRRGPTRDIAIVYHVDRTLSRLSRSFIAMVREDLRNGKHRFEPRSPHRAATTP